MKRLGTIVLLIATFTMILVYSCKNKEVDESSDTDSTEVTSESDISDPVTEDEMTGDATENESSIETSQKEEYTAHYICPNHCEGSGADEQGECSECGMELIENPDFE